ncbi:MAG: hypothetical protein NZ750_07485 [Anaerolineae bacterium]|nr:hypothetical protein [Anaerolineae bacterium]MDW8172190.1 hypothetical protein [Anaerolineae bacterium]
MIVSLRTPEKIWLEMNREKDSCDAIVSMDDGTVYTALFVTFDYLKRQLHLNQQMTRMMGDMPSVRYAVIDTPHILVDDLSRDTIEDTIDALIAQDVFESHFTLVTEEGEVQTPDSKRATKEVAAVIVQEVLVIEG